MELVVFEIVLVYQLMFLAGLDLEFLLVELVVFEIVLVYHLMFQALQFLVRLELELVTQLMYELYMIFNKFSIFLFLRALSSAIHFQRVSFSLECWSCFAPSADANTKKITICTNFIFRFFLKEVNKTTE